MTVHSAAGTDVHFALGQYPVIQEYGIVDDILTKPPVTSEEDED